MPILWRDIAYANSYAWAFNLVHLQFSKITWFFYCGTKGSRFFFFFFWEVDFHRVLTIIKVYRS